MSNTQAIISWFVLIALTFLSVYLSEIMDASAALLILVFCIVFFKGQQITDVFMELKNAPTKWRVLLLCYSLILPSIICAIYLI